MKRLAIFIDYENVFYAEKAKGWNIDWIKLYNYFQQNYDIYNAFLHSSETTNVGKRKFLKKLSLAGYTIRTKPIKKIHDKKTGNTITKCNLDIEIVIDMFNTADNYDVAVLISGDSDFERAIELLRSRGKQIIVLSFKNAVSYELINAADRFISFEEIRSEVEYKK